MLALRLPSWFPRLSRRAWIVIGLLWLAIYAILWFIIPIEPTLIVHCDQAVRPIGFGPNNETVITVDWHLGQEESERCLHGPVRLWDVRLPASCAKRSHWTCLYAIPTSVFRIALYERVGSSATRAKVATIREPALIDPRKLPATLDSPPARRR